MRLHPFGKVTRRTRKIWVSFGYVLLGTVALTLFAGWVQIGRDTDRAHCSDAITASFLGAGDMVAPPIRFRDVADAMGIATRHGPGPRSRLLPEDTGSGLAWADYDGDGDWDLYLVSFPGPLGGAAASGGTNRLFRNDGDRFTDVTETAGVADPDGFGMGASFADFDDDGDVDLYVTNYGPNRLYRNRGDGTFEDVAKTAGVADSLWSTGACWGDFDRDGNLDLYVCNYVRFDIESEFYLSSDSTEPGAVPFTLNPNAFDPQPNRLYRNRGDGTFEEVAGLCGVSNPEGRSLAATFCDLDGDGWLDLYVNNDVSANKLLRNMAGDLGGDGPCFFADLSTITGTADPRGSMGLSIGEVAAAGEGDGLPDLFITHWVAQENAFYQSTLTAGSQLEYRDKTRQFRLGEISIDTVGWGTALVDLDLDGWIDLAVANGSTLERTDDGRQLIAEPAFLFWNDGERFHNVAAEAGTALSRPYSGRGLAAADFDGDGDIDLAVAVNRGRMLLLRNESPTANRSLIVTLRGRAAACFGARVQLDVKDRPQVRWWGSDVSYLSMHAPEMVFGLGKNGAADRVQVRWADGKTTVLTDVAAGRIEVAHPDAAASAKTRLADRFGKEHR